MQQHIEFRHSRAMHWLTDSSLWNFTVCFSGDSLPSHNSSEWRRPNCIKFGEDLRKSTRNATVLDLRQPALLRFKKRAAQIWMGSKIEAKFWTFAPFPAKITQGWARSLSWKKGSMFGLELNLCYIFDGRLLHRLPDYGSGKKVQRQNRRPTAYRASGD